MNESAATAWIIERLEMENTKMEEEMGNMAACDEDFVASGVNYDPTLSLSPLVFHNWNYMPEARQSDATRPLTE